jgi:hypothetical protein
MVAASSSRMRLMGSSVPTGRQASVTRMGMVSAASASSAMCSITCRFRVSQRVTASA